MKSWNIKLNNHEHSKYLRFQLRYSDDMSKLLLVGQLRFFSTTEWQDIAIHEINPNSVNSIDDISDHIFNILDKTEEKANEIKKINDIMTDVTSIEIGNNEPDVFDEL